MSSYVFPSFKCIDGRKIERSSEWGAHVEETTSGQKQVDTWWAADRKTFRLLIVIRDAKTISAPGMPWDGLSETDVLDWFWLYHRGMTDTFLYNDAKYGQKRVRFATNGYNKANLAPGVYSTTVELEEAL
jgi:hypothetical protein